MSAPTKHRTENSLSAVRSFHGLIARLKKEAVLNHAPKLDLNESKISLISCLKKIPTLTKELFTLQKSILIASLFINLLGIALPLVILQVYDRIIPNSSTATLAYIILGLIGVVILEAALKIARANVMSWLAVRRGFWSEAHIIHKILKSRPNQIETQNAAIWLDRLDALSELNNFEGSSSKLVLLDLPFTLIFLGMIIWIGGVLAFVPITLTILFSYIALQQGNKLKHLIEHRTLEDNKKYDFISECLKGIQTIKSMAMEPQMQRRFERLKQSASNISYHMIRHSDAMQSYGTLYANMTMIGLVTLGAIFAISGTLSIGSLACCTLLAGRLIQPIMRGFSIWSELQNILILEQKLKPFEQIEVPPAEKEICKPDLTGNLSFQKLVLASEAEPEKILFEQDHFVVPFGHIAGIRAIDDKAKMALLQALKGELPPLHGAIYIDGYNISSLPHGRITEVTGYTSTSPVYFRGSILQNLTMFQIVRYKDQALNACRLIGLEDDIHRLPEGYDTFIGEGISTILPEGFLQRLAIARAIARQPRILIMDEPNTMVDTNSDALLKQGLLSFKGEMTIVLFSNRPSFLNIADKIYTLESGKITDLPSENKNVETSSLTQDLTS